MGLHRVGIDADVGPMLPSGLEHQRRVYMDCLDGADLSDDEVFPEIGDKKIVITHYTALSLFFFFFLAPKSRKKKLKPHFIYD